jgi:type II secretory pathway pseudopilin PulG
MRHTDHPLPRGITLMEVLISLGILSVGLLSILSLIPAGRSQAVKATVYDQATATANNALADIVSRGFLDPSRFVLSPRTKIDFLGDAAGVPIQGSFTSITSQTAAKIPINSPTVPFAIHAAGDDRAYTTTGADDPPQPTLVDGIPLAENKFTWLATIQDSAGGPLSSTNPGTYALLSVVVFHRRSLTADGGRAYSITTPASNVNGTTLTITSATASTDDGEYLRSGAVVMIDNNGIYSWRRVLMAALQKTANLTLAVAEVTVDGPGITPGATVSIYAYKGAVELAERIVRLEGDSPWSLP